MSQYRFKMLTPQGTLMDEDVVSIVAPGEAGHFGVLANHAPLIATLASGDLRVTTETGDRRYKVEGGIFRVAKNSAVLLSESIKENQTPAE